MHPIHNNNVTGVILAGGQARRMGGVDKGLVKLHQKPMIEHVIQRLQPQVATIMINANRSLSEYQQFGVPVIQDELTDYQGPLAGMASALQSITTPLAVFVPCDAPQLPCDFVDRLIQKMNDDSADVVCAHNGDRPQPVHALIKKTLLYDLQNFLANGGRKIDQWYATHRWEQADFSDVPEAFINVNTPSELEHMNQHQENEK